MKLATEEDDSASSGDSNDNNEKQPDDKKDYISYKESCNMPSAVGCLRCNPGYYVDGMYCKKCKPECATCIDGNSCSSCINGNMTALKGVCVPTHSVSPNCRKLLPNGVGCAFCQDGYYRNSTSCQQCPEGCETCLDNKLCHNCKDG